MYYSEWNVGLKRDNGENNNRTRQSLDTKVETKMSSDGKTLTIVINDVSFNMILVDGGTFVIGATEEQGDDAVNDELPTHSVTLDSFLIGETEVTQELWEIVMGYNPSKYDGKKNPVECVSWYDCKEFIKRLNVLTNIDFRLPAEAELEFAARGGNKSHHYKYAGSNDLCEVSWCWLNSGDKDFGKADYIPEDNVYYDHCTTCKTHPVGTKQANELGLYDMNGNVSEWCEDWEGEYEDVHVINPQGPANGSWRITRGGDNKALSWSCRVSSRCGELPNQRYEDIGMRLALKSVPDNLQEIR